MNVHTIKSATLPIKSASIRAHATTTNIIYARLFGLKDPLSVQISNDADVLFQFLLCNFGIFYFIKQCFYLFFVIINISSDHYKLCTKQIFVDPSSQLYQNKSQSTIHY
jgi:hypothetical protein